MVEVGETFGRWRVLSRSSYRDKRGKRSYFFCLCSCGTEKEVNGSSLTSGRSTSCGCYRAEVTSSRCKTHGLTGGPEWLAWNNARQRCFNQKTRNFSDYGGRGISMCPLWKNSFSAFISFMGVRPSPKHTLERKNNSGGYSPTNCVWAFKKENCRNTRANRHITYKGKTQSLAAWVEFLGLNYKTTWRRLSLGWSIEEAFREKI